MDPHPNLYQQLLQILNKQDHRQPQQHNNEAAYEAAQDDVGDAGKDTEGAHDEQDEQNERYHPHTDEYQEKSEYFEQYEPKCLFPTNFTTPSSNSQTVSQQL